MFGLINAAVNAVKKLLGGSKPKAPKAPVKVVKAPKVTFAPLARVSPYIASWGQSAAQITRGMAQNASVAAANRAAQAAYEARKRAEAERRRKLEAARRKKRAQINKARSGQKNFLNAFAQQAKNFLGIDKSKKKKQEEKKKGKDLADTVNSWLSFLKPQAQKKKKGGKVDWETQIRREYADRARKISKGVGKERGGFLGWWDSLTGGRDTRRKQFAENELRKIQKDQYRRYDKKQKEYYKFLSKHKSTLEKSKFGSQAEYDKALKIYKSAEKMRKDLIYRGNAIKGSEKGFREQFGKSNSFVGKATTWAAKNVVPITSKIGSGLFKYTLGSGNRNTPSLVTAPSRAINSLFNAFRPKGSTLFDKNNKKFKSTGNAWRDSFNQQNFNVGVKKEKYRDYASRQFLTKTGANKKDAFGRSVNVKVSKKAFAQWEKANRKQLTKGWKQSNKQKVATIGMAADWALDPVTYAGFGITSRPLKMFSSKVNNFAKRSSTLSRSSSWFKGNSLKIKSQVSRWGKNISQNPTFQKTKVGSLLKEHQTLQARRKDFVLKELDDVARKRPQIKKLLKEWESNSKNIKASEKIRYIDQVSKDFASMSRKESKFFQHYVHTNKFNFKGADKLTTQQKAKFVELGNKYRKILDEAQLKEVASGVKTPYRVNYLPQYSGRFSTSVRKFSSRLSSKEKKDWWFTKPQKERRIQSKRKLMKSIAARQYHGAVSRNDLPVLRHIVGGRKDIAENFKRINDVKNQVPASTWEKIVKVGGLPTRAWKKSVLLGNPAWYINNESFNLLQGVSRGGTRFLKNQKGWKRYEAHLEKNFKSKYSPSKAEKMLSEIRTGMPKELNKEVGLRGKTLKTGRYKILRKFGVSHKKSLKFSTKHNSRNLSAFAIKQENRSRVALYKTFREQGMSHSAAVKKLNNTLFSYKTRNIERPLKGIAPFYNWQKGLAKAAVRMPFEAPKTAKTFNTIDRASAEAYDKDFETMRDELKKYGYSDKEIDKFKKDTAKYFEGKAKIFGHYVNTPFLGFTQDQLSNIGINPLLSSLLEVTSGKDKFGKRISADERSFWKRYIDKFPQIKIGLKAWKNHNKFKNKSKYIEKWIGGKGAGGYGMTKERQGLDKSKKNYSESLDPGKKLGQDVAAFFGVPRAMKFDKKDFLENKKFGKIAKEYFKKDWNKIEKEKGWAAMDKERTAFFKKYGVTDTEFYEGVLNKNDSAFTKQVKKLKKEAAEKNRALFKEYAKQPYGTRSVWAKNKLKELNKQGYFKNNPFLKSFDWLNPETIASANRKEAYDLAKKTGDWSAFGGRKSRGLSQKALDYRRAKASGDWSDYIRKYGSKFGTSARAKFWRAYSKASAAERRQMLRDNPQYATRKVASEAQIKEAKFWAKYSAASKEGRRQLLAKNPQYNRRKNWTTAQWEQWRKEQKTKEKRKLRSFSNVSSLVAKNIETNKKGAAPVLERRKWNRRKPKAVWRV